MSTAAAPSRRERLRTQALAEIREHGYAQIAEGGPTALSLNGIAKAMGMSGPAMYRYFASRDALLATLVTESYEDIADTLIEAAQRARRRAPEGRLRAAVDAYRRWALAHPHRYRLVFGSTYGSGALEPERVIPAAHRGMSVTLAALAELGPAAEAPVVTDAILKRQLADWGTHRAKHRSRPASCCSHSSPGRGCTASSAWRSKASSNSSASIPRASTRPRSTTSSPNARAASHRG